MKCISKLLRTLHFVIKRNPLNFMTQLTKSRIAILKSRSKKCTDILALKYKNPLCKRSEIETLNEFLSK